MIFTTEIVKCNVPNKNGHIYSKECVEKALNDVYVKERFKTNSFFGGFMDDCNDANAIEVANISHCVRKCWWEGDTLFGEFETLDTPKGKLLEEKLGKEDNADTFVYGMAIAGVGDLECNFETGDCAIKNFYLNSINYTREKA